MPRRPSAARVARRENHFGRRVAAIDIAVLEHFDRQVGSLCDAAHIGHRHTDQLQIFTIGRATLGLKTKSFQSRPFEGSFGNIENIFCRKHISPYHLSQTKRRCQNYPIRKTAARLFLHLGREDHIHLLALEARHRLDLG